MEKVNSDEALASPRAVCRPTTDRKKNNESEAMIRETVWSRRLQGHDSAFLPTAELVCDRVHQWPLCDPDLYVDSDPREDPALGLIGLRH
ncbi:Alginate biosynthesis protein AlgK [Dissostichus eleginoides]|uniref:Alginate biosynthesis protein AlgK n=1 Tax=Dissostichus eleginoides TaxID=100907 RepID=A0AAD9EXR0_DISEL|nr:Alginate biosynthesis protein AlgK [Dissostichus eleginoides]